jgi:DNA-binding response OmpR family regulator
MGGQRILLVEDESITRKSLADFLRAEGYDVYEASDGARAVELFENRHFDLVITDLVMPQLNGFKLIAKVHSISRRTPIILITAYLSAQSGKALLQGEAELIGKPIEPDLLLAAVQHLLYAHPTIYRRKKGLQSWHFCRNCSHWPRLDFDEQPTAPPLTDALCNECESRRRTGDCQGLN